VATFSQRERDDLRILLSDAAKIGHEHERGELADSTACTTQLDLLYDRYVDANDAGRPQVRP
jgi:hypothetical protein